LEITIDAQNEVSSFEWHVDFPRRFSLGHSWAIYKHKIELDL